jgi:heme-degrading monooxygenase HmoA
MGNVYTSGIWTVKEGHEADFIAAWKTLAESGKAMPGAGNFHLLRDVEQTNRFMSFGDWESLEAQRAWKESDDFAARMGRTRQYADLAPSTYEVVTEG